jgi:hypothetical protein
LREKGGVIVFGVAMRILLATNGLPPRQGRDSGLFLKTAPSWGSGSGQLRGEQLQ